MKRTITYREVELEVEFDYEPEEPMVMYYTDGSGYPGSAARIDNITISIRDLDITSMFDDWQMGRIEELIWDVLSNEDE